MTALVVSALIGGAAVLIFLFTLFCMAPLREDHRR
jgi:hypothetical protein